MSKKKWNKKIDFCSRRVTDEVTFSLDTDEYNLLKKLYDNEDAWEDYIDEMGICSALIEYNEGEDEFIVSELI